MERLRVRPHGRYGLEIKSRYLLDDDAPKDSPERGGRSKHAYDVGVYFFFPHSFNISPQTFRRERFYEGLKLFLRFDTPGFSMDQLLDGNSETSPLARCERMVDRAEREEKDEGAQGLEEEGYRYESKLLANVYKSQLRDWAAHVETLAAQSDEPVEQAAGTAARTENSEEESRSDSIDTRILGGEIERRLEVVRRFHRLNERVEGLRRRSEALLQHSTMIDEHLSLLLEKYLTTVVEECRRAGLHTAERRAERCIEAEMDYREGRGYPSVTRSGADMSTLESYVHREKVLKRYAAKVLFNVMKVRNVGKAAEHVMYAAAAGVAMFFATTIAFLGQTTFGNLSLSLFVLLVASYMLKDRIKDIFRDVFLRLLGERFFDRSIGLYDPRFDKKLGKINDHAGFVREKKLVPGVLRVRNRESFDRVAAGFTEEQIFRYRKRVLLDARRLHALHRRIRGFADVTIVDVEPFLRALVRQRVRIPVADERGKVQFTRVKRVYHLNMVLYMKKGRSTRFYARRRIIADGSGILRVEEVT